MERNTNLIGKTFVQAAHKSATTGKVNTVMHNIGIQFGRSNSLKVLSNISLSKIVYLKMVALQISLVVLWKAILLQVKSHSIVSKVMQLDNYVLI